MLYHKNLGIFVRPMTTPRFYTVSDDTLFSSCPSHIRHPVFCFLAQEETTSFELFQLKRGGLQEKLGCLLYGKEIRSAVPTKRSP